MDREKFYILPYSHGIMYPIAESTVSRRYQNVSNVGVFSGEKVFEILKSHFVSLEVLRSGTAEGASEGYERIPEIRTSDDDNDDYDIYLLTYSMVQSPS